MLANDTGVLVALTNSVTSNTIIMVQALMSLNCTDFNTFFSKKKKNPRFYSNFTATIFSLNDPPHENIGKSIPWCIHHRPFTFNNNVGKLEDTLKRRRWGVYRDEIHPETTKHDGVGKGPERPSR